MALFVFFVALALLIRYLNWNFRLNRKNDRMRDMNFEEEQIVKNCQNGKMEEFEKLYNFYLEKVYKFIYYRTSEKETSQDLTSEIFIKALDNIRHFSIKKGSFSAWLFRIARNRVIDYYRTKKTTVNFDRIPEVSSEENLSQKTALKEGLKEIRAYLNALGKDQKEIVLMRVWDELSYQEIAETIGKSQANCRMIFSRAIARLRDLMS